MTPFYSVALMVALILLAIVVYGLAVLTWVIVLAFFLVCLAVLFFAACWQALQQLWSWTVSGWRWVMHR